MRGIPNFPHTNEDITRTQLVAMQHGGEEMIRLRNAAPEGSEHSTHNGGHVRFHDKPMAGSYGVVDYETRLFDD